MKLTEDHTRIAQETEQFGLFVEYTDDGADSLTFRFKTAEQAKAAQQSLNHAVNVEATSLTEGWA